MAVKINVIQTYYLKDHEVLRQYREGRRDFQRVNLSGQSFQAQNLSGADFTEANLRGANFSRANLTNTKFRRTKAGLARTQVALFRIQCGLLSALWGITFAVLTVWVVGLSFISERLQENIGASILGLLFIELLGGFFLISFRKGIFIGASALVFDVGIFMSYFLFVDEINFYLTVPIIILAIVIAISVPLTFVLPNIVILLTTAITISMTVFVSILSNKFDTLYSIVFVLAMVAVVVFCGIFSIGIFTFAAAAAKGVSTLVGIAAIAAALALVLTVAGAIPYTVTNDIYFDLYNIDFDIDSTFLPIIGLSLLVAIVLTLLFGTVFAITAHIPYPIGFVLYSGSSMVAIISLVSIQPIFANISGEQFQVIYAGFRMVFIVLALALIAAVAFAVRGYIVATIVIVIATAVAFALTGYVPVAIAVLMVTALLSMSIYIGWRTYKGSQQNAGIRRLAIAFAATGGTSFRKANLTDADFSYAQVQNTDLRGAILDGVCWHRTKGLESVRLDKELVIGDK